MMTSIRSFGGSGAKRVLMSTPHRLRHSSLSALAKSGWKPELLQERAGHASFQHTYQLYVHVTEDELHDEWTKTQQTVSMKQTGINSVRLAESKE